MADMVVMPKTDWVNTLDAIREKTGSSDLLKSGEVAAAVEGIQTGGGGATAQEGDITFYDYDGTIRYSWTLDQLAAATELPAGPEHDGLVFQRWNWSLEDLKATNRKMNVGANYTTDDRTTRVYIHLEEGRTSPMMGLGVNGTVRVDWGDGTTPDTLTGTNAATAVWTPTHNYAAPGDYVIRLTVTGTMNFRGSSFSNEYSCILRYSSSEDNRNYVYRNAVRKVEVGNGVAEIRNYAFYGCYSLASITIPYSVTSIGNYAFHSCYSLASIAIPYRVTSIGIYAFRSCYSLASIAIPDGVTSIGNNAFYDCCSLASIAIPDGVTSVGDSAFCNCYSLASIAIPDGVTSIGTNVFYGCYSLASVAILDGVTSIGTYVFRSCYSLASITIPDSVTSIVSGVFYGCYGMRYYDFTKHTAVPTLANTDAFAGIRADCEIRVPAALYDEWIAATNWSTYASQIVAV